MQELQAKQPILANTEGGWFLIDGHTFISVKVTAGSHRIEVKDSEDGIVETTDEYRGRTKTTIIATGFKARVVNTGDAPLDHSAFV